jgi:hypothetical protein
MEKLIGSLYTFRSRTYRSFVVVVLKIPHPFSMEWSEAEFI